MRTVTWAVWFWLVLCLDAAAQNTREIPRTWDDAALADWATPVAGLNVRPAHVSAKEYYSMPVDNLRSYPAYVPGREPDGYWEMLQHVGPKPLIEPEKLKSEADWIEAGRIIFNDADVPYLRTLDPKVIAMARSREAFKASGIPAAPDGTRPIRWVPTKDGVALSSRHCPTCHVGTLADGKRVPGAPSLGKLRSTLAPNLMGPLIIAQGTIDGTPPFDMGSAPIGMRLYQAYGVPWLKDDIHDQLKVVTETEYYRLMKTVIPPRWNGSPYYAAKTPDLISIKERKYLDATATHLHRGIGDLMRYGALISSAEAADFGPYRVLLPETKRYRVRRSDEALYALALYIYSLQPPANPNVFGDKAKAGRKIFAREGCATCHTPPLYTSNKLALAQGFTPPEDKPHSLDVLPISVGTDAGLALKTRKGTGYYKIPSLKGVWYRGYYLHDGSAASLEEMFDPDRLRESHVPGGWRPPGVEARAIKGHEFGLKLNPEEREQLIAFLKTL